MSQKAEITQILWPRITPSYPTEENEAVDTLELIRTAHLIDQHLEKLASAVSDEALKKTMLVFQAEWQEIAYDLTRLACGIEAGSGTTRKRASRKRAGTPNGETPAGDESQIPIDAREGTWPKSS